MTPQTQAPSSFLGISAKSLHRARNQGVTNDSALIAKTRRFDLLRQSQALLHDPAKAAPEQLRVCWCHRSIRTRGDSVAVWRQDAGQGARLAGITTCGSVWHCPVCAAKITESRRRELDLALKAWLAHGGEVQLLTLTFPHQANQALADLLARFGKALTSFKNSKGYKRIMGAAERAGSIRSLETTWGENGWHPHTHDLVFTNRPLTVTDIDGLKDGWFKALKKADLAADFQKSDVLAHGLDLQDGRYAAEYVAKFGKSDWDLSAEMTKPHSKSGRAGEVGGEWHYTPFQLLAWAADGDEKAAGLFREFAAAFQGKRMLSWSPKLRLLLTGCENELSDEELAAHDEPAPDETRIGAITGDQLAVLLSRNRLGDFHTYVAKCCSDLATAQQDIDAYIDSIAALPRTHSSRYLKKPFLGRGPFQVLEEAA